MLLFLLAAVLGAVGQWLYKTGSDRATDGLLSYLNLPVIGGIVCYTAVMVLFVAAFKVGGQPQVLYPIYASTFIFAAALAWVVAGQPIRPVHMAGMACLVLGMFLMGR
jgi:multidrug transporter EmrE-like cation transporter